MRGFFSVCFGRFCVLKKSCMHPNCRRWVLVVSSAPVPKSIIIAIDGFSSCGKSTLAKDLAARLNYRYIDTGAMYRAVTLYFIQHNTDIADAAQVEEALKHTTIEFHHHEETNQSHTYLNGVDCETEIRSLKVAGMVSPVSAISAVRKFLVKQQQQMGTRRALVMDGRDIGTVVFPDAELKIFVTADPAIRVQRRYDEIIAKGLPADFDEIAANLRNRDTIDTTRADSPLTKAADAIELDNSFLSRQEQFEKVYALALEKIRE